MKIPLLREKCLSKNLVFPHLIHDIGETGTQKTIVFFFFWGGVITVGENSAIPGSVLRANAGFELTVVDLMQGKFLNPYTI